MTIGENIRRLREQAGWEQAELARRAGLRPQHLNAIERGRRQAPTVATLRRLARAMQVPIGFLMEFQPDSPDSA